MINPRFLLLCLAGVVAAAPLRAEEANNESSVQKLHVAKFVMPEFPDYVRLTGNSKGLVTVAIGRDGEGQVNDVLVLSSTHALLSKSVVEAVRQWKFTLPANPAPPGQEIVPIVRFIFTAKGISIISAPTAGLVSKDREADENAPIILPRFADLDAPPPPVHHPMPRFTGAMAHGATGGTATVKFFVDETGQVRVPIVLECTTPELGRAAIAAVEQWRFEPPKAAGHATIAVEVQTFSFGPPKS